MLNKKRLLLIGIDGASYETINTLIDNGQLPNISSISSNGIFSPLTSPPPVHAATSWTSAMTGKNPGKHDIYDFYGRMNGSYRRSLISSSSIKAKTIWQILDEHQKRSIIVNLPITSPPTSLNGIMIGGMLSPTCDKFTFPSILADELLNLEYSIDALQYIDNSTEEFLAHADRTMQTRQKVFLNLLKKNDWDFAAIDFTTIDRLQLTIWEEQDLIHEFYTKLDTLLGDIFRQTLDDNTIVLLFSGYGARSISKKFFVNEWLWELGMLNRWISPKPGSIPDFWDENFIQHKDDKWITSFLSKTKITKDNISKVIPSMIREMLKNKAPAGIRKIFPKENLIIDWSKTKAYLTSQFSQGININLKGREPHGIVNPGTEHENLKNGIIRELYRLKDPFTFENVIEEVHLGEDIFHGEFSQYAPDIVFVPRNYDYVLRPGKRTNKSCISNSNDLYPILSGPEPNGMFMMHGPGINAHKDLMNPQIYDIFSTVLESLDIHRTEESDGKSLLPFLRSEEHSELSNFQKSSSEVQTLLF